MPTKAKAGLAVALFASALGHTIVMLVAGWRLVGFKLDLGGQAPTVVPMHVVKVPIPPAPPKAPDPLPVAPAPPPAKAVTAPPAARPVLPTPEKLPSKSNVVAKQPATPPDAGARDLPDAGLHGDSSAAIAEGPADGGAHDDSAAVPVAALDSDAGPLTAAAALDAGPPQKVDPAVLDLRAYVPAGARVMVVLRGERLRGTRWARPLDALLAPMPDYRIFFADSGLTLSDAFDSLVIASPAPREVTATFLAGRAHIDDDTLRRVLARPSPGEKRARIDWASAAGGMVGTRHDRLRQALADPRVFLVPAPGWFVLTRPEYAVELLKPAGTQVQAPDWLTQLGHVEAETGDALAVMVVADLPGKTVTLPGVGTTIPAPLRFTLAVSDDPNGLVLTGAVVCTDEAAARETLAGLNAARAGAMGSVVVRVILRQLHAEGAIARLQVAQEREFVTFSTSLSLDEAQGALDQAAAWTRDTFLPRPR